MPDGAVANLVHAEDVDPMRLGFWRMSRAEAEAAYVKVFQSGDINAIRWLGANDRYFLLTCLLRRPDCRHDWIYARCREVEADPDNHIDLWAREHYKSTIITFAGVIQDMIREPELCQVIFSHNRPAAKAFLLQIKLELEDNKFLYQIYPDIFFENPQKEAAKWNEDEGICVRRKANPREASLEAWGIDSMPTGKHFGKLVYDDIIDEKDVTNPDAIKRNIVQYELSVFIGSRECRQQMIGTRYHFADTYGVILQRKIYAERRYPATHDGTFDGRPVFLSDKRWSEIMRLTKSTVAAQMLLNPLAGSEVAFDIRQLKFWEVRPKRISVYVLMDASKGRHAKSDDTAVAVIGIDINRNKYLLEALRHRMPLSKRWETLRNLWKKWTLTPGVQLVRVGVEQFGMQTDAEYFDERMKAEDISFPIEELAWPREGLKSKEHRIERLEPDFRMGRLRLPRVRTIDDEGRVDHFDPTKLKNCQEVANQGERYRCAAPLLKTDHDGKVYDVIDRFLEEYMFFPFAPRDDLLDAMSRIYDMEPEPPVFYGDEGQRGSNPLEPEAFLDGP